MTGEESMCGSVKDGSICKGLLFLFMPLLLAGVLTFLVEIVGRNYWGAIRWYWIPILFVPCFVVSFCVVGLVAGWFDR